MTPRLVFSDMDDTFLATDKSVPAANLALLDELEQRGIAFVPCTGRPVSGVPAQVLAHPATRYVVGSNGAVVHDVARNARLHVSPVDKELVLALYERVRGLHTTFDVFADGEVLAERERYEAMGGYGIDAPSLRVLRRVRKPVDLTVPQIVAQVGAIEKITCFWCDETDRAGVAQAVAEVGGLSNTSGHPKNFELQAAGVNKGFGLVWLCDYLGVDVRDTVAFGDESNDVPLLRAAGDGVAVANATEQARAAADHITASNDDAGVARYLRDRHWGQSPLANPAGCQSGTVPNGC